MGRIPRIAGDRLQRIRAQHFRLHPLCVICLQASPPRIRPAVELDHIVPLSQGGPDFDRDGGLNRQGLCAPCHASKTAADLGYGPAKGCDASGLPLDPAHPWNRTSGRS